MVMKLKGHFTNDYLLPYHSPLNQSWNLQKRKKVLFLPQELKAK
jgi:hypothetical protein